MYLQLLLNLSRFWLNFEVNNYKSKSGHTGNEQEGLIPALFWLYRQSTDVQSRLSIMSVLNPDDKIFIDLEVDGHDLPNVETWAASGLVVKIACNQNLK